MQRTLATPVLSRAAVALLFIGLLFARTAAAQSAWLPTRGQFDFGVSYTNLLNQKHYLPDGSEVDAGSTRSETIALKFQYGLTDRLTLSGGIPYVRTWYEGGRPHPGDIDDGDTNETFTDLRLGMHYQASEGPIAFAPYLQFSTPVADYETLGHAAPGRGLDELWLGFFAGRDLDHWLRGTYLQMRYNYAFVEEVAGVFHDRSNAELELGFRATPRLTLRGLAMWQHTHGGIDVPVPVTDPLFPYHDQLAAEDYTILGAGGSFSLAGNNNLFALFLHSIEGRNGHKIDQSITLGWSTNFDWGPK